jgi:hypothetical protein
MTLRLLITIIFSLVALTAQAEERVLTGAEISTVLADNILVGATTDVKVEQIFQKAGVTLYIEGNAQSQGLWKVEGDSYCSVWPPSEHWACYTVTQDANKITFISKFGTRYAMKPKERQD